MCRLLNTMGVKCFLCYTDAPSQAKVSLTENITYMHVEVNLVDYTRSHAIESVWSFPVLNLAND